jgi:hypothetical protein
MDVNISNIIQNFNENFTNLNLTIIQSINDVNNSIYTELYINKHNISLLNNQINENKNLVDVYLVQINDNITTYNKIVTQKYLENNHSIYEYIGNMYQDLHVETGLNIQNISQTLRYIYMYIYTYLHTYMYICIHIM